MSLEENIKRIADALELIANREAPTVHRVDPMEVDITGPALDHLKSVAAKVEEVDIENLKHVEAPKPKRKPKKKKPAPVPDMKEEVLHKTEADPKVVTKDVLIAEVQKNIARYNSDDFVKGIIYKYQEGATFKNLDDSYYSDIYAEVKADNDE